MPTSENSICGHGVCDLAKFAWLPLTKKYLQYAMPMSFQFLIFGKKYFKFNNFVEKFY